MRALVRANVRFWPAVLPRVLRELRRWEALAQRIPDPRLRDLALEKLSGERFNAEVAATLATLVPRRHLGQVVDAIVALQVMYDYLDGLSEQPAPDPLENSRTLFSAFTVALTIEPTTAADFYCGHPQSDDGGYLDALVSACRRAFAGLPAAAIVAPAAREAALRCGESQTRTHAIEALGTTQLAEWAAVAVAGTGLTWWEYTAGATASILCVHALIAAAADEQMTSEGAKTLDGAYLFISAISTLLDSVIDLRRDVEDESHSFIGYYENDEEMVERIGMVVARAAEVRGIRNGGHHRMTAAGVAAYYLSAPEAAEVPGRAVKVGVTNVLPLVVPALGIFRLWRSGKATMARR